MCNLKYKIIYTDPPWEFKVWSKKGAGRTASSHYDVMSVDEIKSIPIQDIADKDSVLFLWATYPNLLEALDVMKAWGYTYKTVAFTWVKTNKNKVGFFVGLGYYTRANPEICLLGTKGKGLKRVSKSVRNLVVSPREEHSKMPDEVRNRIVELFGDVSKIELFARKETKGWDAVGYEIDGMDIMTAIKNLGNK